MKYCKFKFIDLDLLNNQKQKNKLN